MTKMKEVKQPANFVHDSIYAIEKIEEEIQVESTAIENHLRKLEDLRDSVDILINDTDHAIESLNSGSHKMSEAIGFLSCKN